MRRKTMARKSKGFIGKLRGLALSSATKKAMSAVNARVKKWESEGIDEDTINEYLTSAAKIEGLALKGGKLVIEKDLNRFSEAQLKSAIPTYKDFKKVESTITKEVEEIAARDKAAADKLRAELAFKAEVKRLGDKAVSELWDTWYSDHSTKERNTSIMAMDAFDRADLADRMVEVGRAIHSGIGKAISVDEIYELIEDIEKATGGSAR